MDQAVGRGRRHQAGMAKREELVKHVSRKVIVVGVVAAVAGLVVTVTGATAKTSAGILACGLMPDTKTSVRWEQFDKPYLIKAFKAAKISARVVNAQGDPQKQKTQADQCISDGAKVLIIAPIDSGSAAAIEKAAAKKGVKSIDYDRQVEGGSASLYVSFDGHTVGVLQGQGVVAGLKANGKYGSKPVVASLWGGEEDANSFLFKGGCDQARQGPEAPDDRDGRDEGALEGTGLPDPAAVDHEGELHAAVHVGLPQEGRRL